MDETAGRTVLDPMNDAPEPIAFRVYGPIARADLPGLCLDQRRERVHVVALEGLDVASEELPASSDSKVR